MWVRLNTVKFIKQNGTLVQFQPGDWVRVGKHVGRDWIEWGDADEVDEQERVAGKTAGIVVRGSIPQLWHDRLAEVIRLRVACVDDADAPFDLPFSECIIWTPDFELRPDLYAAGFSLLKVWQVAIPLLNYETLAADLGSEEEREATAEIIRDLRVPVRDTRLIFMRRCPDTARLLQRWHAERAGGGDERLAWLRAVYAEKPLVCDLPASWASNSRR